MMRSAPTRHHLGPILDQQPSWTGLTRGFFYHGPTGPSGPIKNEKVVDIAVDTRIPSLGRSNTFFRRAWTMDRLDPSLPAATPRSPSPGPSDGTGTGGTRPVAMPTSRCDGALWPNAEHNCHDHHEVSP